MCGFEKRLEFRTMHMPIFMLSVFLGILSYSVAVLLMVDSYFENADLSWKIKFYFITGLSLSTLQVVSGSMILHGRPRWVVGMIVLYVLCLMASLPAIFFQGGFALYSIALCIPLLGLYCLNSVSFRLMLAAAAELRSDLKTAAPYARIKTSNLETAINNRLRDLKNKAAAKKRRARSKITYPIGAIFILLLIGGMTYMICDGFANGYILLGGRGSPVTRYTLSEQPGGFWYGITIYSLGIVLSIAALGVMRLMYKMEARE